MFKDNTNYISLPYLIDGVFNFQPAPLAACNWMNYNCWVFQTHDDFHYYSHTVWYVSTTTIDKLRSKFVKQ